MGYGFTMNENGIPQKWTRNTPCRLHKLDPKNGWDKSRKRDPTKMGEKHPCRFRKRVLETNGTKVEKHVRMG
jgi:hypothetical protein